MKNHEVQFILQAYRPDGQDAQDPQFTEALEQVRRDPALQRWFEQQRAEDTALSRKVQSVPVPTDLRDTILAGRKLIRPQSWWARHPALTALAACLMLIAGGAALWQTRTEASTLASFREDMVRLVAQVEAGTESLQFTTADLGELQQWIQQQSPHADATLPASLTPGTGIGCRVIEWHGHAVLLACFKTTQGPPAHLLVIDARALGGEPAAQARLAQAVDQMNTTAWSAQGKTYLLVSRASPDTLEQML